MKTVVALVVTYLCCSVALYASSQPGHPLQLRLKGQPSHRDLLHRYAQLTKPRSAAIGATAQRPDTLRILAIRVEFQPDTLQVTNGTGRFLMTPPDEPTIDPAPHDRAYFDAQLQALANYFATVSRQKLILTWNIYPQANTGSYTLPRKMNYYAPGKDSANADQRLAELFRDAFTQADQQDDIDFSHYDSFMLFHAGVGSDLNFDFDPTPNDVPSAFLNFTDLKKGLAPGDDHFKGIAVQNGQFFIQDGIILPETESQEGFEIGLLGTAAIMMGFQIGLPSLFNPDNGASGIGRWGLMDQGSGNFQGMLPAEPSAWEKVFMGWETPVVIENGQDFKIAAPRVTLSPNHIYKIPINADEYFLLENRQRDINGDNIAVGQDVHGNRVEFKDPGQILADNVIGVITSVDEYDFGLPGSGILIWHIDESVIRAKLADNRINSDRDHRGVDLEEADGAQDIGRFYGFLDPGSGAENGVPEDAWHKDNPINKLVNNIETVRFGPNTMPSSRSNSGANSHIVITNFSENKGLMSFSVLNDRLMKGFPRYIETAPLPPMAGNLAPSSPGDEIVVACRNGTVFAFDGTATPLGRILDTLELNIPGQTASKITTRMLLKLDANLDFPPALGDLDADGRDEMILDSADGILSVYRFDTSGGGLNPQSWWKVQGAAAGGPVSLRASDRVIFWANGPTLKSFSASGEQRFSVPAKAPISKLAVTGSFIFVAAGQSVLLVEDGNPTPLWARDYPNTVSNIAIADLDNDGELEFIAVEDSSQIHLLTADGNETMAAQPSLAVANAGLAVGDVDGDGRKDLVFGLPDGIYAANMAGSALPSFPAQFLNAVLAGERGYNEPLLIDADGDQNQEIFLVGRGGDLYGVDQDGELLPGFPIAFSASAAQSPLAADIDGDGELELVAVSNQGMLSAFRLPGTQIASDHSWTSWGGDAGHVRSNLHKETPQQHDESLLPPKLAYNYPNPTEGSETTIRYRLNGPAQVTIKILDLAGELVDEFPGPAQPFVDNEVKWSLHNIQSGVYLARVEARGQGKTGLAIFKIAVVK